LLTHFRIKCYIIILFQLFLSDLTSEDHYRTLIRPQLGAVDEQWEQWMSSGSSGRKAVDEQWSSGRAVDEKQWNSSLPLLIHCFSPTFSSGQGHISVLIQAINKRLRRKNPIDVCIL
jgi:hypothetical protein